MTNCNRDEVIDTVTSGTSDRPDHFVNRSVPVLFTTRRGLQLRKFHSVLHTGQASYTVQFCDLERWSNHFKVSSVGLTPDSSVSESQPAAAAGRTKSVKFVRQSPQNQSTKAGSTSRDNG